MSDIDAYIARFTPEKQERLLCIRQLALHVFEDATEKMYYGYPSLFVGRNPVMFYGAYKNHVSICVGEDWIDFLKVQFPAFAYTKATILFQHSAPLPADVIRTICELLRHSLDVGRIQNNQ